jgi:hypothetical protein
MRSYELVSENYNNPLYGPLYGSQLNDLSNDEQIKIVSKRASDIVAIKNPNEAVQLAAVKKSAISIVYIKNPTPQVQLISITKTPDNIEYIDNPTDEVKNLAISKNGTNILYVKGKLSKKIIDNNKSSIIKSILTLMQPATFWSDGWNDMKK